MSQAVHPQQVQPDSHSRALKTASGLNFLAGVYLIISVSLGSVTGKERSTAIVFGIIVALLAASRFANAIGRWGSWLTALIGVWLIISPWVYGDIVTGWMWNALVVGLIMLVLGSWAATSTKRDEPAAPPTPPR